MLDENVIHHTTCDIYIHFKGIKNVASINKSKKKKKIKYLKSENMIKTNAHVRHICLNKFSYMKNA